MIEINAPLTMVVENPDLFPDIVRSNLGNGGSWNEIPIIIEEANVT